MLKAISGIYVQAGKAWCKAMHPDPMWPVKGKYICPTCQRAYPVPWEKDEKVAAAPVEGAPVVQIRPPAGEQVAA